MTDFVTVLPDIIEILEDSKRGCASSDYKTCKTMTVIECWPKEMRPKSGDWNAEKDCDCGQFAENKRIDTLIDILRAALSVPAPQTSAERDYTPEEALAEAKRRWGPNAQAIFLPYEQPGPYRVMVKTWPNKDQFWWSEKSFRAAFAETDKAPKTGGDK